VSFAWTAPSECPDATSIEARIDERLGGQLDAGHHISVVIERDGAELTATIEIDEATAPRTLTGATCAELSDAVVVIVARLAAEQHAPRPAPPPAPLPAPPRPVAVVAAVTAEPDWRFGARLSSVGAVGLLPGVGLAAELAGVVEHGPWSGELAVTQWATAHQDVMATDASRLDVGLRALSIRAGWRVGPLPVRLAFVGEAGSMSGHAASSGSATWLAVGAGVAAWWQVTPRWRVVAGGEGDLARDRARFVLSDGTTEYSPAWSSLRGTLGVEVQIP